MIKTSTLKVFFTSLFLFTYLTPSTSAPFALFSSPWRSSLPSYNFQWKRAGIPLYQTRNDLDGITSNHGRIGRGIKSASNYGRSDKRGNPLFRMMNRLEGITSNLGRGIKRAGIFADSNPLSRLSTGLEGITSSLGKGVKSLLNAGSILRQRAEEVLGLSSGLGNRPSPPNHGFPPPRPPQVYEVANSHSVYDEGPNDYVNQFVSAEESSIDLADGSYGSPIGTVQESYESPTEPVEESYGSPIGTVQESYESPTEPVQESYRSPIGTIQESYESPTEPVEESYGSPIGTVVESYESPTISVQESHSSPIQSFEEIYKPTPQEANNEESYGSPLGPVVVDLASTSPPQVSFNWDPIPQITPTISNIQQGPSEFDTPTISNIDQGPSIEADTPTTSNLEHAVILGAASVIQGASAPVPDQENPSKYEQHDLEKIRARLVKTLYYKDLGPLKANLARKLDGKVRHHLLFF